MEIQTKTDGLKVFPTNRSSGNYTVGYKGFMYLFHVNSSKKRIFRCYKHKDNCTARLYLSMDYKSVINEECAGENSHNHPTTPGKIDVRYALWKIRCKAESSQETEESLLASTLQLIPKESQKSLPRLNSLKRTIRRYASAPRKSFQHQHCKAKTKCCTTRKSTASTTDVAKLCKDYQTRVHLTRDSEIDASHNAINSSVIQQDINKAIPEVVSVHAEEDISEKEDEGDHTITGYDDERS